MPLARLIWAKYIASIMDNYLSNIRPWFWSICSFPILLLVVTRATAQTEQQSHPNLIVDASARFVTAGLAQSLDYTQPLNDFILGARVTGLGYTSGTMEAELVADPRHATMRWLVNWKLAERSFGF